MKSMHQSLYDHNSTSKLKKRIESTGSLQTTASCCHCQRKGGGDVGNINFEELYTMYSRKMHYIAFCIIRDRHIAEDIVQEAFIKAFKKSESIEDTSKIGAWLAAITARTAIDFFRGDKRRFWVSADLAFIDHIQQSSIQLTTEDQVEIRLFKEELNSIVSHLSSEYREVLVLRLQYGLKEKEIASVLQLKSATVKTRLHRARKQLKQTFLAQYTA
jgi:RNA polymerase sigma-70 factor (ECF subfamily)